MLKIINKTAKGYLYEFSSIRCGILSCRCTRHMQPDNSVHVHEEIVWRDSNANVVPRPHEVVHKGKK